MNTVHTIPTLNNEETTSTNKTHQTGNRIPLNVSINTFHNYPDFDHKFFYISMSSITFYYSDSTYFYF